MQDLYKPYYYYVTHSMFILQKHLKLMTCVYTVSLCGHSQSRVHGNQDKYCTF